VWPQESRRSPAAPAAPPTSAMAWLPFCIAGAVPRYKPHPPSSMSLERRALLVMYELDEMSCEELAEILGVPTGTVHSRHREALSELVEDLSVLGQALLELVEISRAFAVTGARDV
jgi:hypothetical protein